MVPKSKGTTTRLPVGDDAAAAMIIEFTQMFTVDGQLAFTKLMDRMIEIPDGAFDFVGDIHMIKENSAFRHASSTLKAILQAA